MEIVDISLFRMLLGLLLLFIPLYCFNYFRVPLIRSTFIATGRMIVQMSFIGLYLKYLFEWNSTFINILWFFIMVIIATFTVINRTRMKRSQMFMPVVVGLGTGAIVVCLYALLVILGLSNPFDARYFIPIMGSLLGNMLGVNVLAMSTYYERLQREKSFYYYLLGNGATHIEALSPFVRKAIEVSFLPCIANMAVMGLVAFPGTMTGQILGGSIPEVAIKYQMIITFVTFCAPIISLIIALWVARKYSFDEYLRVRDVFIK